ncbi:MAG: YlxR family protein [Lachnospiraceae bacterium]|nr:YlxR family protein [Lachnospiraceae bacterium]
MQKKIPVRQCIGCGEMKEKKGMLRIVRNADGIFTIDGKGKINGRGAYICKDPNCFEMALKKRGLERSFKGKVPAEIYEKLQAEAKQYE